MKASVLLQFQHIQRHLDRIEKKLDAALMGQDAQAGQVAKDLNADAAALTGALQPPQGATP